jgi:hypothetical protein
MQRLGWCEKGTEGGDKTIVKQGLHAQMILIQKALELMPEPPYRADRCGMDAMAQKRKGVEKDCVEGNSRECKIDAEVPE